MENSIYQLKEQIEKGDIFEHLFCCVDQAKALSTVMAVGGKEVFSGWSDNIIGDYGRALNSLLDQIKFLINKI